MYRTIIWTFLWTSLRPVHTYSKCEWKRRLEEITQLSPWKITFWPQTQDTSCTLNSIKLEWQVNFIFVSICKEDGAANVVMMSPRHIVNPSFSNNRKNRQLQSSSRPIPKRNSHSEVWQKSHTWSPDPCSLHIEGSSFDNFFFTWEFDTSEHWYYKYILFLTWTPCYNSNRPTVKVKLIITMV